MDLYDPAKFCVDNADGVTNDARDVVNEPAQDSTGGFFVERHEEPKNSALPDGLYGNLRIYNDHLMQADQRLSAADERLRAADARFDQHLKDDNLRFDQYRKDDNLRFDRYQDRYDELWKDSKKEAVDLHTNINKLYEDSKKEAAGMQMKINQLVEKNAELAMHGQLYHQYHADVDAKTKKIHHLIDENTRLTVESAANKKDAADHGSSKMTIKELELQRDSLKLEWLSVKAEADVLMRDSAELRAKRQHEQGYIMMFVLAVILAILAYLASCVWA